MAFKQKLIDLFLLLTFPHVCLSVWISERIPPTLSAVIATSFAVLIGYLIFFDKPDIYYQLNEIWFLLLTAYLALPGLFFLARGFDKGGFDKDELEKED
ncbi:hypothetical protein [Kiloniella antarctica]|uniref:Uncharacterized protein n=1 Tax=Kiloniella antarctica TaxID=1550907 RepID=A0ABW5BIV5_9PROT